MKKLFFKFISKRFPRLSLRIAKTIVSCHRGLHYTSEKNLQECSITIGELLTEADKLAIELKMKGIIRDPEVSHTNV